MVIEVRLKAANLKLQGAETRAKEAEVKVIVAEAMPWAVKGR